MKEMKKVLSFFLVLVMVLGMVPAMGIAMPVKAAENDTIYILAGGDFQEAGDHANSAANVTNILAQVSQKYTTMDGFLFIGDYDCETHNSATETANGITALMGAVQGSYSNLNDANSVLVQGNHDYMDSRIDATGGHDFDGYAAYVLNEDDYPNDGGSQSGIQTLANNLKTWLNNKIGEGYSAPIFIVSHLPLAFTPRTVTQGDAKYAKYIFDVLNDAGANGLNIIFLHGHDHAYGPDNYMGGEAIYLPVGDKICIAEAGSTSSWTEETLNFTYMNAGYTGYYSDAYTYVTNAGTDKLTMTVFAITDNQVTVERYSEDGLYNLKSAGYNGSYSNTSVDNVSLGLPKYSAVYASPQTIALVNNGAADMGTIGEWVGIEAEVTDDVTTSGNGWVQIIAPVPGTDAVPASTTYKYTLDTDGTVNDRYDAELGYLIVAYNSGYAMTGDGSVGRTNVSVSNNTITLDEQPSYEWRITSDNKITNGTYWLTANPQYSSCSIGVSTNESDAYSWTISHSGNGQYAISARYSNYRTWYLRYSSSSFSTARTGSNLTVRLFSGEKIVVEGSEATPGKNGTYGKIVGNLGYTVANGASRDAALAAVMAGIDGYYYEAMSTPGSSVTGTKVEDGVLTWELDSSYNGNVPGDYAVKISYTYNGTKYELGTAEVVVPATTTYYLAEGNGLYLVDMNTTEANAMAAVKAGITVYSATDAKGTGKTAISDDDVEWKWVDKYNGADSGPYTYTLDTDGIDYGEEHKYIIVDDNQAIVLTANSSSDGTAHSITISGNTATLDTRDYEYHMIQRTYNGTRYELITKGDGSQYLYQESNGVRYGTRSSVKFQVNHHGSGVYDIHDIDGTNWYIIYNGGWTVTETTSARVRLYKYTGTTGGTSGGPIYALIEGKTVYTVDQGTSATKALAAIKAGITGYTATDANGTGKTELEDSKLSWKWKNTYNGMVTGSYWVEISYEGKVLGTVEVIVEPGVINNYPEYPDEGAVKVGKTATGIDFQASGIAQVELSASGVPSKKGADVIIMLDTSSSMTNHTVTGTNQTRAAVLEESLVDLIAKFKTPGDDGQTLDLRVAIADFNGFYGDNHNTSGTPYDRDAEDMMSDDISYNANSEAKVYTGDGTLGAGAFIPVEDLAASYTLNYTSGTNYDYAMDAIYQLGTAIKEANTEDRDLYVIFMSDGAAMQWNYYHSQGASSLWNNWICGNWGVEDLDLNCTTHAYYYNDVDTDGDGMMNEHRMANAIKGDPAKFYEVIRKVDTLGTPTGEENMYMVPGLGATMFAISFDAQADTNVTEESMDLSIETLASDQTGSTQYYYKVTSAEELSEAFNVIGTEIAYAANNARYVDQVGDSFNLQLKTSTYTVVKRDENGNTIDEDNDGNADTETKTLAPVIEILTYDIYTKVDSDEGNIPTGKNIGDRKGTSTLNEVIKFSEDGTKAYSNLIDADKDGTYGVTITKDAAGNNVYTISDADDNIFGEDGIIYARTFIYNSGVLGVAVEGVKIPVAVKADGTTSGSTNVLPSETFYWKMDTITTTELAMRYYVYLEGSMEGTANAGSYPTNEFAILYYDNYLGNPCRKETVSPTMPWKAANVSYAFYLVNEDGEIIVNQTTGQTGSFANKVEITRPVIYEEIRLNNTDQVESINVKAISDDVLPKYYDLYDEDAVYTVTINSNSTGNWKITKGVDTVNSTYVTQYKSGDASAYSNALTNNTIGDDYTHTIVWFAVVWSVQAHPDTVVIDYGLPVDISVMANDMFGSNGALVGIGAYDPDKNYNTDENSEDVIRLEDIKAGSALEAGFAQTYTGNFGTARADLETGLVRYTPTTMELNGYDKFAYAVQYSGNENAGYYYDTVTVIPATTVYFEDDFVDYTIVDNKGTSDGSDDDVTAEDWETAGTRVEGVQDEDRPGQYSLTDANNIYGYDGINLGMSTFSLGAAKKVTVNANTYATAQFTFYGTGFDIVSMASKDTGTLIVQVYDTKGTLDITDDTLKVSKVVDTYYGYTQKLCNVTYTYENGEWVKSVGDPVAEGTAESKVDTSVAGTEGETKTGVEYCWVLLAPGESNPNGADIVYQVPVIQVEDLSYGRYRAVLTVSYFDAFNHQEDGAYDFYLDAVRIYDPTNDGEVDNVDENGDETGDTTIENAYAADGESWPYYLELRNLLLDADSLNVNDEILDKSMVEGIVFIDGDAEVKDAQLEDYANVGPNNEVYLKPGQRIAFILNLDAFGTDNIKSVHIGLRSSGEKSTYTVFNVAQNADNENNIAAGQYYNVRTYEIESGTDMYYDLTDWKNDIIVISNTGAMYGTNTNLYITNIKITFKEKPVTSIELTVPTKTTYTVGDELDLTGMTVTATYLDNAKSTAVINEAYTDDAGEQHDGYVVTVPDGMDKAGEKTVKVKYHGFVVTFTITVNEPEVATTSVELPQLRTSATAETTEITEVSDGTEPVVITSEPQPMVYMTGYAASVTLEGINAQATEATTPEETVPEEPVPEEPEVPTEPEIPEEPEVPEDPATFDPEKMEVIIVRDTVKKGSSVVVTVLTSADVDFLTVNGVTVTRCSYSRRTGIKTWIVKLQAEVVGEMEISVVANNGQGEHSEAVVEYITVEDRQSTFWDDLRNWFFG